MNKSKDLESFYLFVFVAVLHSFNGYVNKCVCPWRVHLCV